MDGKWLEEMALAGRPRAQKDLHKSAKSGSATLQRKRGEEENGR